MQCYCCANTTTILMIEGRSSDPGARKRLLGAKRSSDPCALAKKTAANTPTQCLRHSARRMQNTRPHQDATPSVSNPLTAISFSAGSSRHHARECLTHRQRLIHASHHTRSRLGPAPVQTVPGCTRTTHTTPPRACYEHSSPYGRSCRTPSCHSSCTKCTGCLRFPDL